MKREGLCQGVIYAGPPLQTGRRIYSANRRLIWCKEWAGHEHGQSELCIAHHGAMEAFIPKAVPDLLALKSGVDPAKHANQGG